MTASVIIDMKTEGLGNVIENTRALTKYITDGTEAQMREWFEKQYKPAVLEILETGQPTDRIPETRGNYREWKVSRYGFSHAFGYLTGNLINGVMSTPCRIVKTRGKEVRWSIEYKNPHYAPYLHGTEKYGFITAQGIFVPARPFGTVARDRTTEKFSDSLKNILDDVDFSEPPTTVSTVIRFGRYGPEA